MKYIRYKVFIKLPFKTFFLKLGNKNKVQVQSKLKDFMESPLVNDPHYSEIYLYLLYLEYGLDNILNYNKWNN